MLDIKMPSKVFKLYGAVASLLLFFVPCISLIVFTFFVRGFVPDMRVAGWDHWYSLLSAAALSVAIIPLLFRRFRTETMIKGRLKTVALGLGTPLFAAALAHSFIVGPCAYAMHALSSPAETSVIERVQAVSRGGRRCRNKLELAGSALFFQRAVCGVKPEDIDLWRSGGRVQLYGLKSRYGFQVGSYRYVNG